MAFKAFQKGKVSVPSKDIVALVSQSNQKLLIRFDDSCKIGLKRFLTANAGYNLPINGVEIIKDVIELDLGVEFELVCFCNSFKNRFSNKTIICADKFKAFLELALNDSPYFDCFSLVCDVFHLGVRKISGGAAKRGIEEIDVSENRKMRPAPVMVASQSFEVCSPFVPPNLVFAPPHSAEASPRVPTFVVNHPPVPLPAPTSVTALLPQPVPTSVAAPLPAHDVFF